MSAREATVRLAGSLVPQDGRDPIEFLTRTLSTAEYPLCRWRAPAKAPTVSVASSTSEPGPFSSAASNGSPRKSSIQLRKQPSIARASPLPGVDGRAIFPCALFPIQKILRMNSPVSDFAHGSPVWTARKSSRITESLAGWAASRVPKVPDKTTGTRAEASGARPIVLDLISRYSALPRQIHVSWVGERAETEPVVSAWL